MRLLQTTRRWLVGRAALVTRRILDAWGGLLIVSALLTCFPSLAAETLYVAPGGDDGDPGTREAPLKSLRGARNRVRTLERRASEDIVVLFAPGDYPVDKTVLFDKKDSGGLAHRVIYRSQGGPGSAMFTGGRRVRNWKDEGDGVYSVRLERDVFAIFENGHPGVMAREPNEGYHFAEAVLDFQRFRYSVDHYRNFGFGSAAVSLWAHWIPARTRISRVDFHNRLVTLTRPYAGDLKGTVWDDRWAAKTPTRYYIYNSRAFLDRAGEFFMDTRTHTLYYRPRNVPIEKQDIFVPTVSRLVSVSGASRITFVGLTFRVTDGLLEVEPALPLHSKIRGGLIHLRDAEDVTVRNCRLVNSGQNGVIGEGGLVRCVIEGNEITRAGSGGIRFVERGNREGIIGNNWIHHVGEGIHLFGCADYRIRHNLIHHADSNGFKAIRIQDSTIAYNDVSRIGIDGTDSDSAGIYINVTSGGPTGGHVTIDHNVVHDLKHNGYPGYPSAAIYLDMDGVYNCTVTNNVIYNLRHKFGIHVRGAHHVIANNIVDLSGPDVLAAFTPMAGYKPANVAVDKPPIHHYDYRFVNNVVWTSSGEIFNVRGKLDDQTFSQVDNNVYFHPGGRYTFRKWKWEEWREMGLDRRTRLVDPRFVNRAAHDYRLRADSPARDLGFQPIDVSKVGLQRGFLYRSAKNSPVTGTGRPSR